MPYPNFWTAKQRATPHSIGKPAAPTRRAGHLICWQLKYAPDLPRTMKWRDKPNQLLIDPACALVPKTLPNI